MKVLLIAPAPPPAGGIETVTESLLAYLGEHPEICGLVHYNTTHRSRKPTEESLFVRLHTGISNAVETLLHIRRILKKHKPDLIHLASSASLALLKDLMIVRMAAARNIPVVLHWHFGRIPQLRLQHNWEWNLLKRVVRSSTWSVVLDQASHLTLTGEGFTRVSTIPNPLSGEVIAGIPAAGVNQDSRRPGKVLFVGHMLRAKGVFELVKACSSIDGVRELVLAGPCEDDIKTELQSLAAVRGNGAWLSFTGELRLAEVLEHMANSPVMVLPSYTEGFPMVVLEAMAMGCAVISTAVGAVPQMLAGDDGHDCGIVIPPQETEPLKASVERLLDNPGLRQELGMRGQQKVLAHYAIDNVVKQYEAVWNQCLQAQS